MSSFIRSRLGRVLCALAVCIMAAPDLMAAPPIHKAIAYQDGDTNLEGSLVCESNGPAKRPGVLLAHEQGPASPLAKQKAAQWAAQGYAVFSVDLYGKGITPGNTSDAAKRLELTGNSRTLVRKRAAAGLAAMEKIPQVDSARLAAVGYGTGGTAVLELARSKADLQGAVCVHGDLTPIGNDGKNVGAPVLVIVGADDPLVPLAQVALFENEMRAGGVDWQILRMGGVAGDFTNPQAGNDPKTGRAHDPDADKRATDAIKSFLAESFSPPAKSAKVPEPVTLTRPASPPSSTAPRMAGVPEKVLKVLEFVDKNDQAMPNYEGGRNFGNFERRLPQADRAGKRVRYREWDVNPLRPGVNRGAERLITGSDGSANYTSDHYSTFKKIR